MQYARGKLNYHKLFSDLELHPNGYSKHAANYFYMVQYASFGNFYSNSGNFQNFDFALIFIVMHHTSSYISIDSCNTLGSYRMRYNF